MNTRICAENKKVSYKDLWYGTTRGASTGYRMKSYKKRSPI